MVKPDGDPVVVGRYAMYGVIGSGGMATVHLGRASDPGGSSDVFAIKRLRPHLAAEPDIVRSFLDEARLSSRIAHPNVVPTLEVVTEGSEVFLVMPYVEGVSLAALTRGAGGAGSRRVPSPVAVAVVAGMLRGLHAAHEAVGDTGEPLRIVHRDVSPQNVLVGVDGTARVLDFGVAKALGRQQTTRDGSVKGKLGYMAPEQLSGRAVTRRTDVFAAGIVLWELLTGRRLFRADDEAATVARVLMEPVRPPSEVEPASPAALDAVVLCALERDPTKRFLTAEEMAVALEAAQKPAEPGEVAAWMRASAAEELGRRSDRVQAMREDVEERTRIARKAVAGPRRGRTAMVAVVAAGVLGAGGWAVVASSHATASQGVAESASVPAPVPSPASASALGSAPAPASALALTPAPSLAPSPPSSRPLHRPAPRPTSGRQRLYSQD